MCILKLERNEQIAISVTLNPNRVTPKFFSLHPSIKLHCYVMGGELMTNNGSYIPIK